MQFWSVTRSSDLVYELLPGVTFIDVPAWPKSGPFNVGCIFRISLVFLATGFIVRLEIWCENSVCADIKLGSKRPHLRNINIHLEAELGTFTHFKNHHTSVLGQLWFFSPLCLFKRAPRDFTVNVLTISTVVWEGGMGAKCLNIYYIWQTILAKAQQP